MNKRILNIRAHHFLCMQGFQGYGYSSKFVIHMSEIVNYIRENLDCKIRLINSCDDICSACFKNRYNQCIDKEVYNMDNIVLTKLELGNGDIIRAKEGFDIVNDRLNTEEDVKDICRDCRWTEKCLWHLKHIEKIDL
ncbi:hypothetical protein CPAST_c29270 [Clostridium pasteurianum DSM 525 = ATCC 6013]|uniref:Iron-sulfur binding protein n=1 Tax=Clostridium pasteurianum DSM 525 = ATCC 6013 TaxID=1262449 RepID=A0A0H3J9U8_CLOPA|nr:DUF1284 domain-containing protein [Clostridium pasteurianum]AJA48993.1 hypothetical protein CPAST_c29270 [Clostridium pasteurianum DSM 525 = ATCC 6013]AJA52981.1 hypothetical protein CLPA_c29270 [Clostridium pasteurianum DSM 525 = ATCC 6013]AOZ76200.1 iron-sulfur binding protein [Clostridium pasteurianum DSM 525 = ATCC 6013]AOZ79996.1 iron-sulfur binding protein [Clostridium pasteurianum]ELP60289.1 Iron-sulfur binding protein [Clostridium pasteurianum DSM 525 = ATCC 6013]